MKNTSNIGNVENHVRAEKYESIVDNILKADQDLKNEWMSAEPKRRIAVMLGTLRTKMGLSQKDICEKTGWNKAYVSRLESAIGGVPDVQTIARYVGACGAVAKIVISVKSSGDRPTILSSTPLDMSVNTGDMYVYEQSAEIMEDIVELRKQGT